MGAHQTQIGLESIKGEEWNGKIILDIGCGSGKLSLEVYHLTHPAEYFGIDLDQEKIEKAKTLFKQQNIINAVFQTADSANLSTINDSTIDVVFCNIAFQQFRDKSAALKEIFRVLKPSGMAIINAIEEKSKVRREMESVTKVGSGKTSKIVKAEFDTLAKETGFSEVHTVSYDNTLFYPTIDALLDEYQRLDVVFPRLQSLSKTEIENMWTELKARFNSKKTSQGFADTWKVLTARLIK